MGQSVEVVNDGDLHEQRAVDDDNDGHPLSAEIAQLVEERYEHRSNKRWKEADRIKMLLLREPYSVEIFDRSDDVTLWRRLGENPRAPVKRRVVWSEIDGGSTGNLEGSSSIHQSCNSNSNCGIPLVVATVDVPHYRARLQDTLGHLSKNAAEGGSSFHPIKSIDMLDLTKHQSLGRKRIIYEGWRQILLPNLLKSFESSCADSNTCSGESDGFILVAEDDIRLPGGTSPNRVRDVCKMAFESNPFLNVLSLGHAWSPAKPSRRQRRRQRRQRTSIDTPGSTSGEVNRMKQEQHPPTSTLLQHLQHGGGVHATTLLAIRTPVGIRSLLDALNGVTQAGKKTHFDQFLFHSTLHEVDLALTDPPLVGWAEVSETLTSAGPGQRNGGGRLEYLPTGQWSTKDEDIHIRLVRRELK